MICRRYVLAAAVAVVMGVAALYGTAASPALAQDSCSAQCRAAYGNCYKRSQNRDACQREWQRCLEQCRPGRRSDLRYGPVVVGPVLLTYRVVPRMRFHPRFAGPGRWVHRYARRFGGF